MYPVVSGTEAPGNGPSIGGGSLWISGPGHSEAEKEAAWELAKFLAQPDSQATWHTQTGYFPVTSKALDATRRWLGSVLRAFCGNARLNGVAPFSDLGLRSR